MFVLRHVANLLQKGFGIIKHLLHLSEGDMTICSPSTGHITLGLRPRAISPASGEQIVMSPSLKGNNCILFNKQNDVVINPYLTNGFSHRYQLDESTFIFRGVGSDFYFFIQFSDEIPLSKQDSPRWDAAFCGVTSGAILFAYVP